MKTTCIIAIIVLIVQVTLAGNVGRVKREDEVETAMRAFFHLGLEKIDISITFFEKVLENLPKTEEFATVRNGLEEYVTTAKLVKTEEGNCIFKTLIALAGLQNTVHKFDDDSSSEVSPETYKAINELFAQYGGEEFKKDINDFEEKYLSDTFMDKMDKFKEEEVEKWNLCSDIC